MHSCLLKGTTQKSNTRRQIFIDGDSGLVLSENTINKCTEAEKVDFSKNELHLHIRKVAMQN